MVVVETDVEARARFAGNQVDGLVPDVDRGELEMGRRKLRAAVVKRFALQRGNKRHQPADRIVCALRIGNVALRSRHEEMTVERAAPADLDRIPEGVLIAGLAE